MREILFRAKVKDKEELLGKGFPIDENGNLKSEWVFGVPIPRYPDLFLAWNEACNEYEEVNIIPETITEYTGLKDKNGTKIFEGDIIQDSNYPEYVFRIEYHNGTIIASEIHTFDKVYLDNFICFNIFEAFVIGNIHDNPELLQD